MCGHKRKEWLRNKIIRMKVGVTSIENKMGDNRLRRFGHVRQRPFDVVVRKFE